MRKISMKRATDGKIFEIEETYPCKYTIVENRGTYGRYTASLYSVPWHDVELFDSLAKAYSFLKTNINNLL